MKKIKYSIKDRVLYNVKITQVTVSSVGFVVLMELF